MKSTSELTSFSYYRGRVALFALLKAFGVSHGDEVATQAYTCLAVPEAIMASGGKLVYIDIEDGGFNMAPASLADRISENTKVIIVQHTFGIPAQLDQILAIAKEKDVPVIEDCCHALESMYDEKKLGTFGSAAFYSFEWGKPVVAGIGGGLRINDPLIIERVKNDYANYRSPGLVTQGKIELQYQAFRLLYRPSLYWSVRSLFHKLGNMGLAESNYNPVEPNNISKDFDLKMAPLVKRRLDKKMKYVEKYADHSRWIADQYCQRIKSQAVCHPDIPDNCDTVFARYPLRAKDKQGLLSKAKQEGVELAEWYSTPVHPLSGPELPLVHYTEGSCPNAEKLCKEVVSLPVHVTVRQKDIARAVDFLNGE